MTYPDHITPGQLLTSIIEELDIPPHLQEGAIAAYTEVGGYLDEHFLEAGRSGCEIYPQGSFRLGTVVRPVGQDDYDIDLVCLRDLSKNSVTQADLKEQVGDAIRKYLEENRSAPGLSEGGRCWTLTYNQGFHMDVLPSIPYTDGDETAILITDRDMRDWQHSNPIGYANWFHARMADEFAIRKTELAESIQVKTEEVADWRVKTTLQRSVQILKRHRDIAFGDDDEKPISIIITTLAAHAYNGNGDLFAVLKQIVDGMSAHIERRDGVWWVPNPVQPEENFADRWNTYPERRRRFLEWLEQVRADLTALDEAHEPTIAVTRLAESLGREPVHKAAATLGLQPETNNSTGTRPTKTRDPGEEFIEDLGFDVTISGSVRINAAVKKKDGFRDGVLRQFGNRVQMDRWLDFTIAGCDIPGPYRVFWKVKNTGREAEAADDLRGEITEGENKKTEHTKYRGDHYVECYIVKNGTCVAVARHPVTIV
jgi:hypothetical protein